MGKFSTLLLLLIAVLASYSYIASMESVDIELSFMKFFSFFPQPTDPVVAIQKSEQQYII